MLPPDHDLSPRKEPSVEPNPPSFYEDPLSYNWALETLNPINNGAFDANEEFISWLHQNPDNPADTSLQLQRGEGPNCHSLLEEAYSENTVTVAELLDSSPDAASCQPSYTDKEDSSSGEIRIANRTESYIREELLGGRCNIFPESSGTLRKPSGLAMRLREILEEKTKKPDRKPFAGTKRRLEAATEPSIRLVSDSISFRRRGSEDSKELHNKETHIQKRRETSSSLVNLSPTFSTSLPGALNFLKDSTSTSGFLGRNDWSFIASVPRNFSAMELGSTSALLQFRLLSLAEAVVTDDQLAVTQLANLVRSDSNPMGDVMQRVAHYCLEALHARQLGKGAELSSLLNRPSKSFQRIMADFVSKLPFLHIASLVAAEEVLEISRSHGTIHIVDLGSWPNTWFYLLHRLAEHPSRCPKIRLTVVDFTDDALRPASLDVDIGALGQEVVQLARSLGILLDFQVLQMTMNSLKLSALRRDPEEALVVICGIVMAHLADSTVVRSSPRDKFLQMLHDAEPALVLNVEMDFNLNSPFFMARFKEMLAVFTLLFDMLDTTFCQNKEQWIIEKNYLARELVNVVACEGLDRYMRFETYQQWRARFFKAGFAVKPVNSERVGALQKVADKICNGYIVSCSDGVFHVSWKQKPFAVLGIWRTRQ